MHNPFSLGHWRPVLRRQPPGVDEVALSYDDGPCRDTTPRLLEILAAEGVRATFFLTGVRVEAEPGLAADVVAAGHDVFGHGWEHENHWRAKPAAAVDALRRVEERLARLRPTPKPYLVRFPYNAGFNKSAMHRAVARLHPDARFAWFSHNMKDYLLADGCRDAEELAARCGAVSDELRADPGLPGAILLLHEAPFGAPGALAPSVAGTLLPMVLDALRARGLRAGPIQASSPTRVLDRVLFTERGGGRNVWAPSLDFERRAALP